MNILKSLLHHRMTGTDDGLSTCSSF